MEHQKLRFRKAFFFRLKPLGPPLLTVSALFISFKSHMLSFYNKYVCSQETIWQVYTFPRTYIFRLLWFFSCSLLNVQHDWWMAMMLRRWEERGERGRRILLNFMMFGIDFAGTGLCVCGWARGNWSYFLLILGNAWHSRGRGVHIYISLQSVGTSHHTRENMHILQGFVSDQAKFICLERLISLYRLCYVNTPSPVSLVFRMMETSAGSPEFPLVTRSRPLSHGREASNSEYNTKLFENKKYRIKTVISQAPLAWFSVKLASLGLFETKTQLIHHLWSPKFQNQDTASQ